MTRSGRTADHSNTISVSRESWSKLMSVMDAIKAFVGKVNTSTFSHGWTGPGVDPVAALNRQQGRR